MTSRRAALSGHTSLIVTFSSWLKFATMIVRSEYVAATDWTDHCDIMFKRRIAT